MTDLTPETVKAVQEQGCSCEALSNLAHAFLAEVERRERIEAAAVELAFQVDCALEIDPFPAGGAAVDKALAAFRAAMERGE